MGAPNKSARGLKAEYRCQRCKQPFTARVADRNRGWAQYCSKSCKAVKQEQRTGQMAEYIHGKAKRARDAHYVRQYGGNPQYDGRGEYIGFTLDADSRDSLAHGSHDRDD